MTAPPSDRIRPNLKKDVAIPLTRPRMCGIFCSENECPDLGPHPASANACGVFAFFAKEVERM